VKPVISTKQHGFVPEKSMVTNLAIVTGFLANRSLDERKQVDVIYIDFEKTFDMVNQNMVLGTLNHYYFSPSLIEFMCSYLTNRRQSVLFKGYTSDEYTALSRVPQGSNLEPLLFLLFINYLPEFIPDNKNVLTICG